MKRFIQLSGCIYVVFAIAVAHSAISARSSAVARNQEGVQADARLGCTAAPPGMVRSANTKLVVWTTPACYGCRTFKRDQVPKLIAAGLYIETIDASTTPPTDTSITAYPTIILYEGEEEIGRWVGDTTAETILAFVPEEEEEIEYRIWDIRRWWN